MKIPYPLIAAVDTHKRHAQMALALQHNYPRLEQRPIDDRQRMTIACYGPSLAQTWQSMRHPILSMSGATRFLAERGVIPDFHADMDPRPYKVDFIRPPVDGVHYLMASVCHPDTWKALEGQKVSLWHVYSAETTYDVVTSIDPGGIVIRGGSTMGLTALHLAGVMGYRHFEIHGMDGSFADLERSARHAGAHTGSKQNKDSITWNVFGKTYATSKIMANAVTETLNQVSSFPIFTVFHGEGLTQALIRKRDFINSCCADQEDKAQRIRTAKAHILDKLIIDPAKGLTPNTSMWDALCAPIQPDWLAEMKTIYDENAKRRAIASYNTGTITLDQMLQLHALTERHKPKTVIEVGTFIGNSSMAMTAERIYTCDESNDCFPSTERIRTYPKQTSTAMLGELASSGVKADLFFFDGRIRAQDVPLIMRMSTKKSMYVFDDYKPSQKGIDNARTMATVLPDGWILVEPDHRRTTTSSLAVFAPMAVFQQ